MKGLFSGHVQVPPQRCHTKRVQQGCVRLLHLLEIKTTELCMTNDPVLIAFAARRSRTSRKVLYERIGRAYPHNAGEGLTVILDAMPLKGWHIVLLELDESDDRRLLAEARRHGRERKAKPSQEAGPKSKP